MIEVLVVLDIKELANQKEFEEYILKNGFECAAPFAYTGMSATPVFNTQAYTFEVFSKAFDAAGVEECRLICQIGGYPPEAYLYKKEEFFTELK
ncbi:MAG: hypothetical protein LBB59_00625 [Campylobacteraceae bacterium]|nr:hypothetical protein [Campylobacteraceae bacterium]